ncbi:MAG: sensor histidine kinase [Marmoricola sp.]
MSATTQALLFALLGAVLGGGVVLAWRLSEAQEHPVPEREADLPAGIGVVLGALRSSALLVDPSDNVLKFSAPARAMGLLEGNRIASAELARLVAEVRRDGETREVDLVIPRGPGLPPRHVSARVAQLNPRLTLALAEDRTREKRLESIRRDFVVNVSHELKTPVGAIKLLSDAVKDASDDPEAVQRFASRMHNESDRLARLVQQIIELSRLQDDDSLDAPSVLAVDDIIRSVMEANATDAIERDIAITHQSEPDLRLLGNRGQIELAVSNLLANAVTYSPAGSKIVLTTRAVEGAVEISVTDQGVGIPPNEIERIFERFYRVDPARHRSTGGTGLGLSIVKHVVASHGGDVRVWSVEGQGSTFTLTLPRAYATSTHSEEGTPA